MDLGKSFGMILSLKKGKVENYIYINIYSNVKIHINKDG